MQNFRRAQAEYEQRMYAPFDYEERDYDAEQAAREEIVESQIDEILLKEDF